MKYARPHCASLKSLAGMGFGAMLALGVSAGAAHAQSWSLEGGGAMQIPTLEELSRPRPPRSAIPPPAGEGALGPFLNDSTLRRGDIVVTPDGPMTFQGQDALSHRSDDFAPSGERGRANARPTPNRSPSPSPPQAPR